jgi:hypothetical protein
VATASAYLSARGLPEPAVTERAPVGDAGQVRYTAGGVGGWVSVARSNPDAPYVVEGATSDRIVRIRAARQDGKLTVNVIASAPGTIVVRTRRPGASAGDISSRPVVAGQEVSLVVVGPDGQDLIVEIRHQGDDGTVGLAETFLPAAADQWSYEALYGGSLIRTGGLGVIGIDTDLASAERAAGVEMTYQRGEYCTSLAPVDQPEGVSFISTRGTDRVDVITVSAPSVHTASGIGVGSSVDDVRQAYPGIEERLTGDAGRLVLGPTGEGDEAFETVFGIADGEVNVVWIGHAGLGNTDELCA